MVFQVEWKATLRGQVKHLVINPFSSEGVCGVKNLTDNKLKAELLRKCKICAELEG